MLDEQHTNYDASHGIPSTAGSQLEADLLDAEAWASVGRSGACVHSKFTPQCAGCLLREATWALRDILEIGGRPYTEMGGESKRELRQRGQAMMDRANRAFKRLDP